MSEDESARLCFRWNGTEIEVDVPLTDTILDVKEKLKALTHVEPSKQKFIGFKTKAGKPPNDSDAISLLSIKPNQKIMMLGTPEAVIEQTNRAAESAPVIKDDFDIDPNDEISIDVSKRPEVLEKLERRLETVKVNILNPPRPGKKLLVVDIDYTIFDLGSSAERPEELARPYLHVFFAACYEYFDLMIWSATSMKWVEIKMRELGVSNNPNYKLVCMLDYAAMVPVQTDRYGLFNCKPLEFIWRKFPEHYNPSNTVMLDDLKRNFIMNRKNGLLIRPYQRAHRNRATDQELLHLAEYFRRIGPLPSLTHLKHRKWERLISGQQERSSERQTDPSPDQEHDAA